MKSLDIKTRRLSEIKNSKSKKFKKQFKKLFKTNFNQKNKIFVKKQSIKVLAKKTLS